MKFEAVIIQQLLAGYTFIFRHKKIIQFLIPGVILSLSSSARPEDLPLNSSVNPHTIYQTICVHGWTKTVRPPVGFTNNIKRQMMMDIGVPQEGVSDITLDHKIPLALGGSPDNLANLMLQPDDESKDKDRVEVCLARAVCAGKVNLTVAQKAIWDNWKSAARFCSGYKVIAD
jgi:hypothetical protein